MDGGHSNMQGVYLRIDRERDVREQGLCQLLDGIGDIQVGAFGVSYVP